MLKIKPVGNIAGTVGNNCNIILECEVGDKEELIWSLDNSTLPKGIKLDPKSGLIYGHYENACLKTVSVILSANKIEEKACTNINFYIQGRPEPTVFCFLTEKLRDVLRKEEYFFQIETEGGCEPIVYEADGLPPGIYCTKEGKLSGKALIGGGKCPLWITATDVKGISIKKYFVLNVLND